jgi:hypothetical protein
LIVAFGLKKYFIERMKADTNSLSRSEVAARAGFIDDLRW